MDGIYLAQKMGKPLSYDMWTKVRSLVDYVCDNWDAPDLSIWEVRGAKQHFLYSKIMLWVAGKSKTLAQVDLCWSSLLTSLIGRS